MLRVNVIHRLCMTFLLVAIVSVSCIPVHGETDDSGPESNVYWYWLDSMRDCNPRETLMKTGNGYFEMEIGYKSSHPQVLKLTYASDVRGNLLQNLTLVCYDIEGEQYLLPETATVFRLFFMNIYTTHMIFSGYPETSEGEQSGLFAEWHIIVNKGEPGFRTYVVLKHSVDQAAKISAVTLKVILSDRFDRYALSDDNLGSLNHAGRTINCTEPLQKKVFGVYDSQNGLGLWSIVSEESLYDTPEKPAFQIKDATETILSVNFARREEPLEGGEWEKTLGPLYVYLNSGTDFWSEAKRAAQMEAIPPELTLSTGNPLQTGFSLTGKSYDFLTGHFLVDMAEGTCQFHVEGRKNTVVCMRLSDRFYDNAPVAVHEKEDSEWARSSLLVPALEFGLSEIQFPSIGYPDDYAVLYVPYEAEVKVQETNYGVRMGHIIQTAWLLEVENNETKHCWNFRNNFVSHGAYEVGAFQEDYFNTCGPRLLGSDKICMGDPEGGSYLFWWAGYIYDTGYGYSGHPWKDNHIVTMTSNGPDIVKFHLRGWSDEGIFRWDTYVEVPYTTDYNRVYVDLYCTVEEKVLIGGTNSNYYSFRMTIGTEPGTEVFQRFAYTTTNSRICVQEIDKNNDGWTPFDKIQVPGWYSLYDNAFGQGNIGVIISNVSFNLHTTCIDEKEGYDEILLCDKDAPGTWAPVGKTWNMKYEVFIYNDTSDYTSVVHEFSRKYSVHVTSLGSEKDVFAPAEAIRVNSKIYNALSETAEVTVEVKLYRGSDLIKKYETDLEVEGLTESSHDVVFTPDTPWLSGEYTVKIEIYRDQQMSYSTEFSLQVETQWEQWLSSHFSAIIVVVIGVLLSGGFVLFVIFRKREVSQMKQQGQAV